MTTFKPGSVSAFVWVYLPGKPTPVVTGRIDYIEESSDGSKGRFFFTYGQSFLKSEILKDQPYCLHPKELPLSPGLQAPTPSMQIASCLRDAGPDAWGRRVAGYHTKLANPDLLTELDYLVLAGSDRIGNLDVQLSSQKHTPSSADRASLSELLEASEYIESNRPLPAVLDRALLHGTSIGGARPKALISDNDCDYIAKFSSSSDQYAVVKAEHLSMRMARACGLNVADVRLESIAGKDILLVKRFDRFMVGGNRCRKSVYSALTLLGMDELEARYTSYEDLSHVLRSACRKPKEDLRELYARLVYNVLCGNTDDHARNHAAFWDGKYYDLTPAYDLCPQARAGGEASQAMLISGHDRRSQIASCVAACSQFLLTEHEAREIAKTMVATIEHHWEAYCDESGLTERDRARLRNGAFLHPYALEGF